jgi:uncharacterized membrane protein
MAESKTNNDVTMAVLSYFLFFLPLIAAKDSKLAMFHANQSLVLLLAWIISGVIGIVPVVGWIAAPLLGLAAFILWIMGIVQAAQGQMKPLPIVGTITLLK